MLQPFYIDTYNTRIGIASSLDLQPVNH